MTGRTGPARTTGKLIPIQKQPYAFWIPLFDLMLDPNHFTSLERVSDQSTQIPVPKPKRSYSSAGWPQQYALLSYPDQSTTLRATTNKRKPTFPNPLRTPFSESDRNQHVLASTFCCRMHWSTEACCPANNAEAGPKAAWAPMPVSPLSLWTVPETSAAFGESLKSMTPPIPEVRSRIPLVIFSLPEWMDL